MKRFFGFIIALWIGITLQNSMYDKWGRRK